MASVGPIDVALLRQQRDYLFDTFWNAGIMREEISEVINLLDSMIFQAVDEEDSNA